MEIGTVTTCTIGVNRDGLTPCRMATCMVSGPTDMRTVQLIGSDDHWPVVGAKLLILEIEDAWEVGIVLDEIIAAATTLIGDRVLAAVQAVGVPAALSQISLRAAAGGSIELGGAADWVVAFTEMKTAFDALKSAFNSHVHPAGLLLDSVSGACTGTTAVIAAPSTADMTAAKVATVKVP